jgi:hypothetical protein
MCANNWKACLRVRKARVPPCRTQRNVVVWRSQRPCGRTGGEGGSDGERVRRRVTGLLNRLAEANVAAVAGELAALHETSGRGAVAAAVTDELLQARRAAGPAAAIGWWLGRPLGGEWKPCRAGPAEGQCARCGVKLGATGGQGRRAL